jgi:hypothetical protein
MARSELLAELGRAARSEGAAGDAEFDALLDRVLEQAGSDAAPEPGWRNVVQERLRQTLAAGAAGAVNPAGSAGFARSAGFAGVASSGVRATAAPGVWVRHGSKLIILAAGVAIGFVWGRAPSWRGEPQSGAGSPRFTAPEPPALLPAALPAEPSLPAPGATRVSGDPAPERVLPHAAETPRLASGTSAAPRPEARAHGPRPRAHAAGEAPRSAESLRLVLEQLRKAQLFSRAGEHRRALAALDELDARVPLSVLQDEREVARTLALCDAGQERAASELAARMIQRAPDSAYALSLRESCAGREQLLQQMRERTSNGVP